MKKKVRKEIPIMTGLLFISFFVLWTNVSAFASIPEKGQFDAKVNEINQNQQKEITGKVTDTQGQPLPGVTVTVKGTTRGTVTDVDGNYSLSNIANDNTLVFSFVGMETQEINVGNQTRIDVAMQESAVALEEVVAIGYGTQKRGMLTGSISSVQSEKLTVAPVASVSNALAGQLPGLISVQYSGQPGFDRASLNIRGFGEPLVIVDGVETDFNSLDANQIESVTILKDGAASIYGARAGNGVLLVTTKRGAISKPIITFNSTYTLQGITSMPKPASSGQLAEMRVEEWINLGNPISTAPFTKEQIEKFYEGTDPLYPNTNWFDYLIRDWAPQQQYNLSARGGTDNIKYYGFVGYLNQESIWKRNGGDYSRYNVQLNIDATISTRLSLFFDISSVFEFRRSTWRPQTAGENTVWSDFWFTLPFYPPTLPDRSKISFASFNGTGGAHVTSNRAISGYNDNDSQNYKGTIALNYNVPGVSGLSAKAFVNVLQNYTHTKNFTRPVKFYTYDPESGIYTLAGALGTNASMSLGRNQGRTITSQLSLNYDKTLNKNHYVNVLALYEAIDYYSDNLVGSRVDFLTPAIEQLFAGSTSGMYSDGSAWEMGRKSYIGRVNYSFKNKYLIEAILRADASAKFPPDKRWGIFPGISVGWRINEENFMNQYSSLDNLKIRMSYGMSGNDAVGNFQYLSGYKYGKTYPFSYNPRQGLVSTGLANPELTWEEIKIYNFGLDFSFWDSRLRGGFDSFYRTRTGIPATRLLTLPSSFGASLPPENINSLNDRGFEAEVGTIGKIDQFKWDILGNLSWSRSKWDHFEEPVFDDPVQEELYKKSGRWTDRTIGYVSDGLFTSQEEINNLEFDQDGLQNITLKPGDIKYKDINNDGKLDWKDQTEIGKGTVPHWMVGFNSNIQYKNIDISALFQGAFGYYKYLKFPTGQQLPEEMYKQRWTETNNDPHAIIPRLGGAPTNNYFSDFYYLKAGYLRLKMLNIGYTLTPKWIQPLGLTQLRIYIAGTNLITFDKLKKYSADPEAPSDANGLYYPQQRTITLGINLSL